jgi:hypothetical protein
MTCWKSSLLLCAGVLLAGLAAQRAMSQDPAPPRDTATGWDNGPTPGGRVGSPRAQGPRRPQADRGDARTPLGGPDLDDGPRGDRPQPPGANSRRPPLPRGNQGDRPEPPDGPRGPGEKGPPMRGGPDGSQPPGPWLRMDMETLKTRDPELYKAMQEDRELERQTRDQAEQYREAGKDEQAKIKDKLGEIVNKHFAVRQQLRTLEVKRLEQQVKQLREKIEQREKSRKDIVAKRLSELIGEDEGEHF